MGSLFARHTLLPTRMLILELGDVVDILVYDDIEIICLVMGSHVACCKCLCHLDEDRKLCLDIERYLDGQYRNRINKSEKNSTLSRKQTGHAYHCPARTRNNS